MKLFTDLFWTFAKIGFFTFGGGYAMIAMMTDVCVEKKQWITHDEMMDVTVIAESTPGPIAINCATYVGYRQAGFWGAAAATLGIVAPSFAVIYAISILLDHFLELSIIAHAFRGIKIAVGLLVLDAGVTMARRMPKKPLPRAIMACSLIAVLLAGLLGRKLSSIALMLVAAVVSLAVRPAEGAPKREGGEKG